MGIVSPDLGYSSSVYLSPYMNMDLSVHLYKVCSGEVVMCDFESLCMILEYLLMTYNQVKVGCHVMQQCRRVFVDYSLYH